MQRNHLKDLDIMFQKDEELFGYNDNVPLLKSNKYRANSLGYRSDEFTSIHNGQHILFAGCSNTLGVGIEDEETLWPKIVFNEIKKHEQVSGFFNIAYPGISIQGIIFLILRYVHNYGAPDTIFIMFPEIYRGIRPHANIDGYYNAYLDPEKYDYHSLKPKRPQDLEDIVAYEKPIIYEEYKMFEKLMDSYGVRVISTTYAYPEPGDMLESFGLKTFTSFDYGKLENFLYENKTNQSDFLYADDGTHWGTGYHAYSANLMYNSYHDKKNN